MKKLYATEQILVALLRGRQTFRVGRYIRRNGSMSAVTLIAVFVTFTNISAKETANTPVGYWEDKNSQGTVSASNTTYYEDGMTLGGDDDSIAQLALGADVETRREAPKLNSGTGGSDELIVDSSDLYAYGVSLDESGELTSEVEIYTIQEGDTLKEIAEKKGLSVNTLLWANDLSKETDIEQGDTIFILPVTGVKHKVAKNDTIDSIAKKYKGKADEILDFNGLPANGELKEGQEIIIPDGEVIAPPPVKPIFVSPFTPITGQSLADSRGRFTHPFPGSRRTQGIHPTNAVDLAGPHGSKVFAADSGVVTKVLGTGWGGGYGQHIIVTHSDGIITLYAHLSSIGVKKGQKVDKGQAIGRVGSTGRSTGPHLHFEVRGGIANPF